MNKKKGEISIEQVIALILVLLVVATVLIFIFKDDILNYIRILPGYELPDEDIEVEVPDDAVVSGNNGEIIGEDTQLVCNIEIATIKDNDIYINNDKTDLYWKGNELNGEIFHREKFIFNFLNPDSKVAEIINGKIYVVELGASWQKPKYQEILNQLSILNGAERKLGNKLCK